MLWAMVRNWSRRLALAFGKFDDGHIIAISISIGISNLLASFTGPFRKLWRGRRQMSQSWTSVTSGRSASRLARSHTFPKHCWNTASCFHQIFTYTNMSISFLCSILFVKKGKDKTYSSLPNGTTTTTTNNADSWDSSSSIYKHTHLITKHAKMIQLSKFCSVWDTFLFFWSCFKD